MIKRNDSEQKLARLEQVLDTFGAAPGRWPETERAALQKLVGTEPSARLLLREARALERVMEQAPTVKASSALKARTVTAAVNDRRHEARVVPITASYRPARHFFQARRVTAMWPAAALAASFAFGIYLGVSGFGGQTFDRAFQLTSLSSGGDDAVSWFEEGAAPFTEDLL